MGVHGPCLDVLPWFRFVRISVMCVRACVRYVDVPHVCPCFVFRDYVSVRGLRVFFLIQEPR